MSSPKTAKSPVNASLDSNQLLSLCQRIRESMSSLEKNILMVQLRLITLSYMRHEDTGDPSLKCFDNLIELCNLSQAVVQLLDELHQKLADSQENSIHYQIASQQLMFFASEWYDNFTPKLNETFELASRNQQWGLYETTVEPARDSSRQIGSAMDDGHQQPSSSSSSPSNIQSSDVRVRDALMRLKQSMGENERLIATITANIEYTRATIETIHDSLQATKLGLDAGEHNAMEAVKSMRQTSRWQILCYIILFALLVLLIFYGLKLLMIF